MILRPVTGHTAADMVAHMRILHGVWEQLSTGLAELTSGHLEDHEDHDAGRPGAGPWIPHQHVEETEMFDDGAGFQW